jgi:hypothetical protein
MSANRTFDPAQMALRGRIGAHVMHARHDPREITQSARAAFNSSFERQADPTDDLPAEERARRADHLRKAHFARLAYLSALSRAKKGGQR